MPGTRLAGQVAVVTGAGRGLGRAYALLLAAEGAKVVVNDLGGDTRGGGSSPDAAAATAAEIVAAGGEAVDDGNDVADGADALVGATLRRWGRIDIVVNNAGISGGGPIDAIPVDVFDRQIDVHYRASVAVLRAAWPAMRERNYGRVVNTSSGSVFGVPWTSAYISAKSAIIGLTRALALDGAAHDIKVNAVMPIAWTRLTEQIPDPAFRHFLAARFAPEAVAPFVGALASPDVPCTGEVFTVGGGVAAKVVLGMTPGYRSETPRIDDYLAHFDQVCDLAGTFHPGDSMAEISYRAAQVGVDFGAPTLGTGAG